MPISQDHHDLFHSSGTSDKLDLFQSLLDSKDLTSDEALALLNSIHRELQHPQEHKSSMHIRYAEAMESLRKQMPEIHEQILNSWRQRGGNVQSIGDTPGSLMEEQAKTKPEMIGASESEEGFEEESGEEIKPSGVVEEHAKGGHDAPEPAKPQEELIEELGETEEEHGELEEEQEHEKEEEKEEEGEPKEEQEHEEEQEKETEGKEQEEKETQEEQEKEEEREKEQEEENEAEESEGQKEEKVEEQELGGEAAESEEVETEESESETGEESEALLLCEELSIITAKPPLPAVLPRPVHELLARLPRSHPQRQVDIRL